MLQRIQSIYLLLASVLMGAALFCPLLEVGINNYSSVLYSYGINMFITAGEHLTPFPTWGILTFTILGALLPLINIFLYKNRKMQLKIGWSTILLIVLYYVTVAVYVLSYMKGYEGLPLVQIGIILPVIALIFNAMAISKIKKDEKLVRSLDRIR